MEKRKPSTSKLGLNLFGNAVSRRSGLGTKNTSKSKANGDNHDEKKTRKSNMSQSTSSDRDDGEHKGTRTEKSKGEVKKPQPKHRDSVMWVSSFLFGSKQTTSTSRSRLGTDLETSQAEQSVGSTSGRDSVPGPKHSPRRVSMMVGFTSTESDFMALNASSSRRRGDTVGSILESEQEGRPRLQSETNLDRVYGRLGKPSGYNDRFEMPNPVHGTPAEVRRSISQHRGRAGSSASAMSASGGPDASSSDKEKLAPFLGTVDPQFFQEKRRTRTSRRLSVSSISSASSQRRTGVDLESRLTEIPIHHPRMKKRVGGSGQKKSDHPEQHGPQESEEGKTAEPPSSSTSSAASDGRPSNASHGKTLSEISIGSSSSSGSSEDDTHEQQQKQRSKDQLKAKKSKGGKSKQEISRNIPQLDTESRNTTVMKVVDEKSNSTTGMKSSLASETSSLSDKGESSNETKEKSRPRRPSIAPFQKQDSSLLRTRRADARVRKQRNSIASEVRSRGESSCSDAAKTSEQLSSKSGSQSSSRKAMSGSRYQSGESIPEDDELTFPSTILGPNVPPGLPKKVENLAIELTEFLKLRDPTISTDIGLHAVKLVQRYNMKDLSKAIFSRYKALPKGWYVHLPEELRTKRLASILDSDSPTGDILPAHSQIARFRDAQAREQQRRASAA